MPAPAVNAYYLLGSVAKPVEVNETGPIVDVAGYLPAGLNGASSSGLMLEVLELLGGSATLAFNGSFDQEQWYPAGHSTISSTTSTWTRSQSTIPVTAFNPVVYAVIDPYPYYQAVLSSVSGAGVIARLWAWNRAD